MGKCQIYNFSLAYLCFIVSTVYIIRLNPDVVLCGVSRDESNTLYSNYRESVVGASDLTVYAKSMFWRIHRVDLCPTPKRHFFITRSRSSFSFCDRARQSQTHTHPLV